MRCNSIKIKRCKGDYSLFRLNDSSIPTTPIRTQSPICYSDCLYLGNLPINDIIPDEATRGKLENGEYECVVIYDEKSITKIAKMVYQTITRTTQTRVAVLKGMSHVIHFGYISIDGTQVNSDQSEKRIISLILDGIVGMEQIHPGMIEVGKKPITQNTDIQKEFS